MPDMNKPVADDAIIWRHSSHASSMIFWPGEQQLLHACSAGPALPSVVSRQRLDPVALGNCCHCGLRLP